MARSSSGVGVVARASRVLWQPGSPFLCYGDGSPCGRGRGACVYTCALCGAAAVAVGPFGAGRAAFFVPVWARAKRRRLRLRHRARRTLALVRRHCVRLSHRPGYEPREGAFAPPRRPVPRVAVPRASGDVSLRSYPPWRRPTSHLAKSPLDKLRLGRSQCATIERPERDDKLVTALALRTKHPCEKLGPPRRHRLSAAPNSQH